jgi:hypothetical protein
MSREAKREVAQSARDFLAIFLVMDAGEVATPGVTTLGNDKTYLLWSLPGVAATGERRRRGQSMRRGRVVT